ncbi:MAG TPA: 16S rRNA (adenine(1518)-N(6)/adenine(1519)-N(6))-dimethyltransferase RsmA [Streptosporangiaceae bacterium]|nr:16S rRNA (adenine(1518)-N(6)/adenine(1519)-N(6))-dimethyltransferase RsmA [Streptosporangiaceae bacterium]
MLGASDVREIAGRLGIRPAKRLGQNFVIDPGTLRRIVTIADIRPDDYALEVGPGLGSLTLALLPAARRVLAIEIDPVLAAELPRTVAAMAPGLAGRLAVVTADAARIAELPGEPTVLVANLPYNAAVPVLLHLLATVPSLTRGVVMVQAEVAGRMTAQPGSRIYGVPTVKLAWFASARRAGAVSRSVFWPVPRVESALVAFTRREPPVPGVPLQDLFAVIDAAFAHRRKVLRNGVSQSKFANSAAQAEAILHRAGVDPSARPESLSVEQFAAIALAARRV